MGVKGGFLHFRLFLRPHPYRSLSGVGLFAGVEFGLTDPGCGSLSGPSAGVSADERPATGVRIGGGAVVAGLTFARRIPLAEPLADGVDVRAEDGRQVAGDGDQLAGEGQAVTLLGQQAGVGGRPVASGGGMGVPPGRKARSLSV